MAAHREKEYSTYGVWNHVSYLLCGDRLCSLYVSDEVPLWAFGGAHAAFGRVCQSDDYLGDAL